MVGGDNTDLDMRNTTAVVVVVVVVVVVAVVVIVVAVIVVVVQMDVSKEFSRRSCTFERKRSQ